MQNSSNTFQKRDVMMDISNYLQSIDSIKNNRHFHIQWKKNRLKKKYFRQSKSIQDVIKHQSQHSAVTIASQKLKKQRQKYHQQQQLIKVNFPRLHYHEITRSQKLIQNSPENSLKSSRTKMTLPSFAKAQSNSLSANMPVLENLNKEKIMEKYKYRLLQQNIDFTIEMPASHQEQIKAIKYKLCQTNPNDKLPQFFMKWLGKKSG